MSEALVIEFDGGSVDMYHEVNELLGLDPNTGAGDWPAGLTLHVGAAKETGFCVFELWESREAQDDFMHTRLGPALAKAGAPDPARVEWMSVAGHWVS